MKALRKIIIVVVTIMAGIFLTACANAKSIIRNALLESTENEKETVSWEEDVNPKYEAAIRNDDMQLLKESLEDGADINDLNGVSPVYYALKKGNLDIAKYLIEQGSNPDWESDSGITLLMASMKNTEKTHKQNMVLEALLEAGANVTYTNKKGISAIDYAASQGLINLETIQILLHAKAKVNSNTLKSALESGRELKVIECLVQELDRNGADYGVSEIVEAALKKDKQKVKALLTNKLEKEDLNYVVVFMTAYGDTSIVDAFSDKKLRFELENGITPGYETPFLYQYALEGGNIEMVRYFVEKGELNFNQRKGQGDYPSIDAIEADQCELVTYMIKNGADINLEDSKGQNIKAAVANDSTKMMHLLIKNGYRMEESDIYEAFNDAIAYSKKEALEYLVENGYDINTSQGSSVPSDILEMSTMDVTRYVIENGGYINGMDGSGQLLLSCIEHNETEKVRYLMEQGADVHTKADGTCLYYAVLHGNVEIMNALIENGVDINEECFGFYALERGAASREMIQILIQAGADVNLQSEEYRSTALMQAAYYGNVDGVTTLLQAGADPLLKNYEGKTALDLARDRNNKKTARLLEQAMTQAAEDERTE